ncbi:hypothetical protein [Demequina salsinemoris]|uniref:hypothetical protein n=1 Tax=Demequina salsinemoris TaxID=577470 RepID=UPI0007864CB5|nr:hypothetical protein [Demequina salsinemoris]
MRFRTPVRQSALITGAILMAAGLSACEAAEADPAVATDETVYVVEDAASEQAVADQQSISPDLPDACDLLDEASLESIVGEAFEAGEFNAILSDSDLAVCDWYASGDSYSTVQVQVKALSGDFADVRAQADTDYGDASDVQLEGADDAFVAQNGTVVEFAVGGLSVTVLHYVDDWVDLSDVTTALASVVASEL